MTSVLLRRRADREGRVKAACDQKGPDWSYVATGQGMPGGPEAGSDKALVLRGLRGGVAPEDTLTLDFWLPELWENQFLLFKATRSVTICHSSLRK